MQAEWQFKVAKISELSTATKSPIVALMMALWRKGTGERLSFGRIAALFDEKEKRKQTLFILSSYSEMDIRNISRTATFHWKRHAR